MKLKLSKLFQNKYLLYVVLVIAVTNVLGYLAKEQYNAVTFFLAIGLLSSYFTKNMTVVLLISIFSTALASSQRIIEGAVGSMDTKKESANDQANKYEINKDIGNIEIKEAGMGSDSISKMEGFPEGVTAEFNETSNVLTIKGTPKEAGDFEYTVSFMANGEEDPPADVTGTMKVVEPEKEEKSDAKGVCKAVNPDDDDNCDGKLEKDCVGKCKWNPILAQPEKESIKASEEAKGKNVEEFKKFCLTEVNGVKDGATHEKGGKFFKKEDFSATCSIKCEKSGDCDNYSAVETDEKFTNMGKRSNVVANVSREGRVDGVDESEGDRIDYAETTKQAYDNLQKMLGADGMKGLASETKKLVAQQKELVDSLGQMAPVLNSAKSTLDSLNLPDMKGITNILSTLKGK